MRPDERERRLRSAWTPSGPLPAPSCSMSSCSRLRPSRCDWGVLGEPQDADLRRATDRLREGSGTSGDAGRDVEGDGAELGPYHLLMRLHVRSWSGVHIYEMNEPIRLAAEEGVQAAIETS